MHKYDFGAKSDRMPDGAAVDLMVDFEAGEDPRVTIAKLNKRIVAFQSAGCDVPPGLLRLSKMLAIECASQSQGR